MRNVKQWIAWLGVLALLVSTGLSLSARPVLAHGEATLTVSPAVAAPGASITVKAEGVEAGEEFTITLVGLNTQVTLGTVRVGDDEDFHEEFTLPSDLRPGIYQVQAVSAEGETLTAELTITTEATAAQEQPSEPSAEPMSLDRSKTPVELITITIGLLLSAGLGLVLVRP